MLTHLLVAIVTRAAAGAMVTALALDPVTATHTTDAGEVICVQHTLPDGTTTPKVCVPLPV